MNLYDVIIIGKGPSGISASLYTQRGNLSTLVIGREGSSLDKAGKIENYYGLEEPISGEKLLKIGESQAKNLGVEILNEEVIGLNFEPEVKFFKVTTSKNEYNSKAILIATGQPNKKITIEGIKAFEGKGVSYCTTCDGFFYRNLSVGVIGNGAYAIHEAQELEAFTKDITIYTNGSDLELNEDLADIAGKYKIITEPISKISGEDFLQEIHFRNGNVQKIDGLFVAIGSASSVDFAQKLGIITEKNSIFVNKDHSTNVEGVFASGDCTGGLKQVSTAVGQGAIAGLSIISYVRSIKN